MVRFRIWIFQTRDSVLFCDLIEVRSKNIEVVLNLMAFEGEEVDIPICPCIFANDLSCFVVLEKTISEIESRYSPCYGFVNVQVSPGI